MKTCRTRPKVNCIGDEVWDEPIPSCSVPEGEVGEHPDQIPFLVVVIIRRDAAGHRWVCRSMFDLEAGDGEGLRMVESHRRFLASEDPESVYTLGTIEMHEEEIFGRALKASGELAAA